jgi:diaminopimelate epimerase
MRELRVVKYQAAGNDFLLVDGDVPAPDDVRALCDRWHGVGADGVIGLEGGDGPLLRFTLVNADGTPAETSGNGLRCFGAFAHDLGRVDGPVLDVSTGAGVKHVTLDVVGGRVREATVAMGSSNFTKASIPMRGPAWETFLRQPFDIGGGIVLTASAVSMGNPHLVLFTLEDPAGYHLHHIGPTLEHHDLFPERTNVEIARITEDGIDVRVWERGVGETLSCGTGACAVAVAAHEAGWARAEVTVRFPGGPLSVERREDGEVLLGGPVARVFEAVVDLDELA